MGKKYYSILDIFLENVIIILFSLILCLSFIQVIFRYIFNSPLTWSLSICNYLYVWLVFIGSAVVIMDEGHLGLSFLTERLDMRKRRILYILINLAIILVILIVFIKEGVFITKVTSRQISAEVGIKMSWIYLAIPTGGIFMLINTIRKILQKGDDAKEDT